MVERTAFHHNRAARAFACQRSAASPDLGKRLVPRLEQIDALAIELH